MLCPGFSGDASVIVPAESVEFNPPPLLCVGGWSSVVPLTVTFEPPHTVEETTISPELIGRKSATPPLGAGNVVTSTIRNLNRVTAIAPVVFVYRRRIESVPAVYVPVPLRLSV